MSDPSAGQIRVEKRLSELTADREELLAYAPTGQTDHGIYFLTLRVWDHPDIDDAHILAIRFAYLTRGDGGDGWTGDGVNIRVTGDPVEFLALLADLVEGARRRVGKDADPAKADMRLEAGD